MLEGNVIVQHGKKYHSPVCLIATHTGHCNHKHCSDAHRKPQYWGISIAEFYNRYEFSGFQINRKYGKPFMIPYSPKDENNKDFISFRQSMNAVTLLAGAWPLLDNVDRQHVELRWTEFTDSYPVTIEGTCDVIWCPRLDVQEYAYYTGPLNIADVQEIDVDAVYPQPEEIYKNLIAANIGVIDLQKGGGSCV